MVTNMLPLSQYRESHVKDVEVQVVIFIDKLGVLLRFLYCAVIVGQNECVVSSRPF